MRKIKLAWYEKSKQILLIIGVAFSIVIYYWQVERVVDGSFQRSVPKNGKHISTLTSSQVKAKNIHISDELQIHGGKGLYTKRYFPIVIELKDDEQVKALTRSGLSVIIVFYAPWCGHCQLLAPKFAKLAEDLQMTKNVTMAAISCDASPGSCSRYKVREFPTILAFGFRRDSSSIRAGGQTIMQGLHGTRSYILKYGSQNQNVPMQIWGRHDMRMNQSDVKYGSYELHSDATEITSVIDDWLYNTLWRRASDSKITTPLQRLEDGLTSFEYLLMNELPAVLDGKVSIKVNDPVESAYYFTSLLLSILPLTAPSLLKHRRILESVAVVLNQTMNRDNGLPKNGVRFLKYELEEIRLSIAMNKSTGVIATGWAEWAVCGSRTISTRELAGVINTKAYSCGIWMIMHFVTVAVGMFPTLFREWCTTSHSQERIVEQESDLLSSSICTQQVATAQKNLIRDLYRCKSCAQHFVTVYNACDYGRPGCPNNEEGLTNKSGDAHITATNGLQIWLFLVHNVVTQRIYTELGGSHVNVTLLKSVEERAARAKSNTLWWPYSTKISPSNNGHRKEILSALRHAYFDLAWLESP